MRTAGGKPQPRTLQPAARPIPLDTLLARHAPAAQRPEARPRSSPSIQDLRLPAAPPRPAADRPTALILCVTAWRCACGSTGRAPAAYALARYDINGHSFRYSRADTADCASLPRETRELTVTVPFCEECFQ